VNRPKDRDTPGGRLAGCGTYSSMPMTRWTSKEVWIHVECEQIASAGWSRSNLCSLLDQVAADRWPPAFIAGWANVFFADTAQATNRLPPRCSRSVDGDIRSAFNMGHSGSLVRPGPALMRPRWPQAPMREQGPQLSVRAG